MILRRIYLYLDPEEFPRELAIAFGFSSRYACNFLERKIKPLRFHSDGFNRIVIQGSTREKGLKLTKGSNALSSLVPFDLDRYKEISGKSQHEFYLKMIEEGLKSAALQHEIPTQELADAIEEFRHHGYKNEWVHQTKYYREDQLRASLLCTLRPEIFSLTLDIKRRNENVLTDIILETKPDEIIFADQFKELDHHNDTIVVRDKFGKILYQTPSL